nr:hypothetical protein [Xenorhabdus bovienii]
MLKITADKQQSLRVERTSMLKRERYIHQPDMRLTRQRIVGLQHQLTQTVAVGRGKRQQTIRRTVRCQRRTRRAIFFQHDMGNIAARSPRMDRGDTRSGAGCP